MSHEPNAPDAIDAVTAAGEPGSVGWPDPPPGLLERAARLLAGDVRPDDYLPVPDEVRTAVADFVREVEAEHGFEVTAEAKQHVLNEWTLLHHHDGQDVLAKFTGGGVLVLAAGGEQMGQVNRRFNPDYRSGFALMFPSSVW